ncbi:MAG: prephenate dehydrogenase [Lachnospiraceae bacterium]|nr:prephenate dehydrogenase [Lachnospiraceae bacterium]
MRWKSRFHTFGFIGFGLIGGSLARAIRKQLPDAVIVVNVRDHSKIEQAVKDGVVNRTADAIDEAFSTCDIVFLCAPVATNNENLRKLKAHISPSCLITDVGSVKTSIHETVKELGLEQQFIGGHPMTGSERIGYLNSKADLTKNAYYILTVPEGVTNPDLEPMKEMVTECFGSILLVLSPNTHDYVTAAISHLPHVISASLVNLVKNSDDPEGTMKMIAAGGFKDITRISSSSPAMWQNICLTNTDNILSLLDDYMEDLAQIRTSLASRDPDALYDFFNRARTYRDSFNSNVSGPIARSCLLTVVIPDEAGAMAIILSMLAFHQVNIKNINITHNREYANGSVLIEFYDEPTKEKAYNLLKERNYEVQQL